tara:strand:- start:2750 stop:3523 length:774 start_codon:yes stop_codon:yes gene_type:complete
METSTEFSFNNPTITDNSSDNSNDGYKSESYIQFAGAAEILNDLTVIPSNNSNKKSRKQRTIKTSPLEDLNFPTKNSWSYPKFKKFTEGNSMIVSFKKIIVNFSNYDSKEIGKLYAYQNGPINDEFLVLDKIDLDLFKNSIFMDYLRKYINEGGNTSKLLILDTNVKSWGKEKVNSCLLTLKKMENNATVMEPVKLNDSDKHFNVSSNILDNKDVMQLNLDIMSEQPSKNISAVIKEYLEAQAVFLEKQEELLKYIS